MKMRRNMRGYAALISTLIISAVLTVLAFQASTSAYLARLSVSEAAMKLQSRANAYSCGQIALFELSADRDYRPMPGGDAVSLSPEEPCAIESVTEEGERMIVLVRGSSRGSHTTLEIMLLEEPASPPGFRVLSFREI